VIAYLRLFSSSEIDEYVRKASGEQAKHVLTKIRETYNLAELSQRPLLLEMIVRSMDRLTAEEISTADLYRVFTDAWICRDRWRDVMKPNEKTRFVTALARTLWTAEKTTIHYQKLQEYIGAELGDLIQDPQGLCEIDAEIRTASFLTRDDVGNYGFAHSSYAEYFLARYLADQIAQDNYKSLAVRRLSNEVIDFLLNIVDRRRLEPQVVTLLRKEYQPLLSENALLVLYRLRRNLLVQEGMAGSSGSAALRVEMPRGMQLGGARLAQAVLEGAAMVGVRLDGADLRQVVATNADLSRACLKGALLSKAELGGVRLCDTDASGCSFAEANLQGADVEGCDFGGADLSGCVLLVENLQRASYKDVTAKGVVLPAGTTADVFAFAERFDQEAREKALLSVYKAVRRMPSRRLELAPDDVASEVALLLLSRPAELARFQMLGPAAKHQFILALAERATGTADRRPAVFESVDKPMRTLSAEAQEQGTVRADFDLYEILARGAWAEGRDKTALVDEEEPGGPECMDGAEREARAQGPQWEPVEPDEELYQRLMEALKAALSARAFRMLIERHVENRSIAEISASEGLTELATARQLAKAREIARGALTRSGITLKRTASAG